MFKINNKNTGTTSLNYEKNQYYYYFELPNIRVVRGRTTKN